MTIAEVSRRLNVSDRTVRRWIASGRRGRVLRSTVRNGRRHISEDDLALFGAVTVRTRGLQFLKMLYLGDTEMRKFFSALLALVLLMCGSSANAQCWFPLPVPCAPCVQPYCVTACAPACTASNEKCGKPSCEKSERPSCESPACGGCPSCPLKRQKAVPWKQPGTQEQPVTEPKHPESETPAEPVSPDGKPSLSDMMAVDFPPVDESEESTTAMASADVPLLEDLELAPSGTDVEVIACFNAINAARNRAGLKALQWDENLSKMAESHCQRMAAWGWIFHSGCGLAENVAMGHRDGLNTFMQWRNSAGHWANLCRRGTKCGLARVGIYWTFVVR